MKTKTLGVCVVILLGLMIAQGQQTTSSNAEQRTSLSQAATAADLTGTPVLEATLRTTALNGAPDTPVTNSQLVVKNVSASFYVYVSGVVTFYDSGGVRCGEGLFKADALAANESVEVDTPGIRIRCSPGSWRIVATSLVPRTLPFVPQESTSETVIGSNLVISVDGEEHPIQLNRPMVLTVGDAKRTIIVRQSP